MRPAQLTFLVALLGCEPAVIPPRPPLPDAPPWDANADVRLSVIEVGPPQDAPIDAPGPDVPGLDAPLETADAGPALVRIDGVLDDDAWVTASSTTTTRASGPPFEACSLTDFLVLSNDTELYLGVRGSLDAACGPAGIVVFVDVDPAAGNGRLLNAMVGPDTTGAVDRVVSGPLTAAELRPDFAWGTTRTPLPVGTGSADHGWRRIDVDTYLLTTDQESQCSDTECESRVALSALRIGGAGTHRIWLAARLGDGTGWATPSLPPDGDPEFITTVLPVDVVVP